jgi:hypothetical protein
MWGAIERTWQTFEVKCAGGAPPLLWLMMLSVSHEQVAARLHARDISVHLCAWQHKVRLHCSTASALPLHTGACSNPLGGPAYSSRPTCSNNQTQRQRSRALYVWRLSPKIPVVCHGPFASII